MHFEPFTIWKMFIKITMHIILLQSLNIGLILHQTLQSFLYRTILKGFIHELTITVMHCHLSTKSNRLRFDSNKMITIIKILILRVSRRQKSQRILYVGQFTFNSVLKAVTTSIPFTRDLIGSGLYQ